MNIFLFSCNNKIDFGHNVTYANITYEKCHYTVEGIQHPCDSWSFDKTYYQSTLTEKWSMVCFFLKLLLNKINNVFDIKFYRFFFQVTQ